MNGYNRVETIELIVDAGTTWPQIQFPDIAELRSDSDKDALVFGISVYSADSVPLTFSGNTNATYAQLQAGFLTLYVLGVNKHFNIPLIDYLNIQGNGASYLFNRFQNNYQPQRIDWTKSFVSWPQALNNEDKFSYLFKVIYDWFPPGTYSKYLDNQLKQFSLGIIKC